MGGAAFGVAACARNDGLVFLASLIFFCFAYLILSREWRLRKALAVGALCVVAFALAYSPYGVFLHRHRGAALSGTSDVTLTHYDPNKLEEDYFYRERPDFEPAYHSYLEYIATQPASFFRRVAMNAKQILLRQPPILIPWYLLPFVGLGLFGNRLPGHWKRMLFCAAVLAPVMAYALFYVQSRFLAFGVPALILVAAYGCSHLRVRPAFLRWAVPAVLLVMLATHSVLKAPKVVADSRHPEFRAAASWVRSQAKPECTLMTRKPQVPFWSHRRSVSLPYVTSAEALYHEAREQGVTYIVYDEHLTQAYRPELGFLLNRASDERKRFFTIAWANWTDGRRMVLLAPRAAPLK